jgi:hypothetical protein
MTTNNNNEKNNFYKIDKIDFKNINTNSHTKMNTNNEKNNFYKIDKIDSKNINTNLHTKMNTNNEKNNFYKIDKIDFKNINTNEHTKMNKTKTKMTITRADGSLYNGEPKKTKKLIIKKKNNKNSLISTQNNKNKFDLKNKEDNILMTMNKTTQNFHKKDKIDLENKNISTNKMSNIKTKKIFGCDFYYTLVSKKISKKNGVEYHSPLERAMEDQACGDVVLKYDTLSPQGKVWVSYGVMSLEQLEKDDFWKTDNHLFEIVDGECNRKLYFDVDDRFISEEDNYKKLMLLNELIGMIIGKDISEEPIDGFMCYGEGMKQSGNTEYKKSSYHFIVKGYYFENQQTQKKAMNFIQHIVFTQDKYEPLRNGVLDFNVYGNNQAFKLPYQTKAMKGGIKQIPMDSDDTLYDYLLGGEFVIDYKNSKEIDVSKFGVFDVEPKQIKLASGKSVLLNFNEAMVLDGLKSSQPKGYKHIVEGMKGNNLDYYLKSIPNGKNTPKIVWKVVGYCIRNIEKDFEKGLTKWAKWTSPYKSVSNDDLREEYTKHRSDGGYGWKMLYNLARVFNKKMDTNDTSKFEELFDEEPTYPCYRDKITQKYIDKDYFKKMLNEYDNLIIKSPMGSGKSFTLKQVFTEINSSLKKKYKSILYFSCKRAFASSMSKDFEAYGFKNYMDINGDFTEYDRIVCSVESIQKCRDHYDLVIIDESESIADNLTGAMFIKNKCVEGATKMFNIIKNSKKVMLMDAYITTRSHNMIKAIKESPNDFGDNNYHLSEDNTIYLQNDYKNKKRTFVDCDKTMLYHNLVKEMGRGNRCVVVCGSSVFADYINKNMEKKYIVKHYNSKNPLPIGTNVNEEWSECDLLIYTPTITAGISYDPMDDFGNKDITKHFHNLFIYSVNVGSAHFRDTIQAHRRIRDFLSGLIYICINDRFKGHNLEQLPTRKIEVLELEEKYKSKLFGDECLSLNDRHNLKWIYDIHIHNILERNVSQIHMRKFATEYLKRENIFKKADDNTEANLIMDEEEWDFNKINSISSQLYCEYRERMSIGDSEDKLDDDEFAEWYKFKYANLLCKDINEPMKEYFNRYLIKPQHRGFVNSVVEYKRMIEEIGGDYTRIKDYSQKKYQDDNIPIEYYDMKYKRYEHIMKIMDGIKLFDNGVMNINKEIYGDDFKVLCEEYSKIPIKTLNAMLTKNYITTKKKEETTIIKPRTLQGIFNQLIREEFGVEIHGTGKYKYKTIDGKKKKFTILTIRNADVNDEDENDLKFYNSEYLIFNLLKDSFELEDVPYIEGDFTESKNNALSSDEEEGDNCCDSSGNYTEDELDEY